jgi:hypothetical protein
MSWTDTSAPSSLPFRYVVRRECRDTRYQATSAEARWEPRGQALSLSLRGRNPTADRLNFEVVGASSGALDVRLFDVQGREVIRRSAPAAGAGRDAVSLPVPSELGAGLYLLRVVGADGRRACRATA